MPSTEEGSGDPRMERNDPGQPTLATGHRPRVKLATCELWGAPRVAENHRILGSSGSAGVQGGDHDYKPAWNP